MPFTDPETARKAASNAFQLDRVYTRRHVLTRCPFLVEGKDGILGIVPAHAAGFCDVAFEFVELRHGNRLRCVGLGRPEVVIPRYPDYAARAAQSADNDLERTRAHLVELCAQATTAAAAAQRAVTALRDATRAYATASIAAHTRYPADVQIAALAEYHQNNPPPPLP